MILSNKILRKGHWSHRKNTPPYRIPTIWSMPVLTPSCSASSNILIRQAASKRESHVQWSRMLRQRVFWNPRPCNSYTPAWQRRSLPINTDVWWLIIILRSRGITNHPRLRSIIEKYDYLLPQLWHVEFPSIKDSQSVHCITVGFFSWVPTLILLSEQKFASLEWFAHCVTVHSMLLLQFFLSIEPYPLSKNIWNRMISDILYPK